MSCAPAKRPPVHRTYAFKQEALQAWDELKGGGTTLVHYCRARKIPVSTFEKWLIKKDEIASVCTADVNKHVLSLQTNKSRKKSKKRKKLCVDSRHQELHEWLVAAPKPLYTGAMRDKVRALWPEWSDEDHPECKTPHYLAKWCRRVAVRFDHTAGSTASSSEASQASSGDDGDFWEDEGSQTQPGDDGDFWVGVAIPDGEIPAAKRQWLCPETMVHTGTTGGHEYVRQPHRKRIMHPIANDDIAQDDFLDDYHFDALLARDSFSAPSSSCDRVVARATATRQTRSVPPSSQESVHAGLMSDARKASPNPPSNSQIERLFNSLVTRRPTPAQPKPATSHPCDTAHVIWTSPTPLRTSRGASTTENLTIGKRSQVAPNATAPPTPAQNASQCCIAGHAAANGEDCFIESEIRRKYLELDAYLQSTTQGEVPPVRSDYAPCATAHTQSKPKGRKTTQTGPRSSPQPIRTTPHSSAAKPAPNDPPRSRVLGHMTPYATLTGPHLSPTSTHAAPASTVTKPTTNPLPNTDNEGHREDPPRPAEDAADVEIIDLCDSDDSEVEAFEAFKALRRARKMEREQQLKKKYEQHQVRMKFEVVPPTALTEVYHHIDDCLPATNSLAPRRARSSRGVAFGTDTHNPHCRRCSKQFQLCDNLITQTECAPGRCSANELCRNQAISKKLFPPTTIVDDSKLTHALRVDESVPAGTKIIDYVGEPIGKEEVAARKDKRHGAKDWYIARVGTNGDLYVDASKFGNNSRFINHACVPNCRFEVWYVDTKPRLMVVANTALEQGTILTLSYMNAAWNITCVCGVCDGGYNLTDIV
ncbi:hypothetical protein DYB25_008607 [Aphanomyces astaci]|uniref:SET domain-containing protein n=1 Tax=Aphanomyces astaci TaxID=112090 RepID=A0A396ZZ53_APHAT|nr:hypothetical protein DYB25_008607 [Aphanomyces astaci]